MYDLKDLNKVRAMEDHPLEDQMNITTKENLTADRVRDVLEYNANTGVFTWKEKPIIGAKDIRTTKAWNTRYAGKPAGKSNKFGYTVISIRKTFHLSHRLAWLYVYGSWPDGDLDHIDGDKANNSISNLRMVNATVNGQNRHKANKNNKSSKLLGVSFHKQRQKFRARIWINGKETHLGLFDSSESAYAAYLSAKRKNHIGCSI